MAEATANRFQGMALGAAIFGAFGAVWLLMGLINAESLNWLSGALLLCGLAALLALSVKLRSLAKHWPVVPEDPAVGKAFGRINAVQWGLAAIAYVVCTQLHHQEYFFTALGVIVGAHFLPLARVFQSPSHYATGAMMIAFALVMALFVPAKQVYWVTCLGEGLILWQSAANTVSVGLSAAAKPQAGESPNA